MLDRAITATNASKAIVALVLNAAIQFASAFHIYTFDSGQKAALVGAVNAALLLYVLLTYHSSRARIPAGK